MRSDTGGETAVPPDRTELFGQPRGLLTLALTEFWERVSFSAMLTLLTLYLGTYLLLPGPSAHVIFYPAIRAGMETVTGPLSPQAIAAQLCGIYVGLAYLLPMAGAAIGDKLIPRRLAVAIGAMLMTAGHALMAVEAATLIALLLIVAGAGLFRGNILPQIGALYSSGDSRRATGFQVYALVINLGAFVAPLVTGILAQRWGWHSAFGFAGLGMGLGLIIYLRGSRDLPADPSRRSAQVRQPLSAAERRALFGLFLVLPSAVTLWLAQSQIWNIYNFWVRDHVDLAIGTFRIPIPWFQALDGLSGVIVAPLFLAVRRLRLDANDHRAVLGRIAVGCSIYGAAVAWLALGSWIAGPLGKVPALWAVVFHLVSTIGWFCMNPVALALFSRAAPASVNGTVIGIYVSTTFVGSVISGSFGGIYERWTPEAFWLLHAAIPAAGGVALLMLRPAILRLLPASQPAPN